MTIPPVVRPLKREEWAKLKDVRLQALDHDPDLFAANKRAERHRFNLAWKELCTPTPDRVVFGLFFGDELGGISMIRRTEDGLVFGGSWMQKKYRNAHHANLLYAARLKWLDENPRHNLAFVFHRVGNVKSAHLNRKHGAQPLLQRRLMAWADGKKAHGVWYRIRPQRPPIVSIGAETKIRQAELLAAE
jgi:RimJ/RimL family protein N-acetyltransferase